MPLIARVGQPERDGRGPFRRIFCGHCGRKEGRGHLPTYRFSDDFDDFDGFELRDWDVAADGALVRVRQTRAPTRKLRRGALRGGASSKIRVLALPARIKCPDCRRLNTLEPFEAQTRSAPPSETR